MTAVIDMRLNSGLSWPIFYVEKHFKSATHICSVWEEPKICLTQKLYNIGSIQPTNMSNVVLNFIKSPFIMAGSVVGSVSETVLEGVPELLQTRIF